MNRGFFSRGLRIVILLLLTGCGQNFSEEGVEDSLRAKGMQPMPGARLQDRAVQEPADVGERASLGGISVIIPQGWQAETPSSSMRLAEYRLPSNSGDVTLAVFHFAQGQGGSVDANIERWLGQFQQPDGGGSKEAARLWRAQVDGMSVHMVDVAGTFSVGAMAGGSGEPLADYRMLGAIVESPRGLYVFKLTGPASSVENWRGSFSSYIESMREE